MGFDYSVGVRSTPSNMASAMEHPDVVDKYLAEECSDGWVLGLLDPSKFTYIHTSRFGVVPNGGPQVAPHSGLIVPKWGEC